MGDDLPPGFRFYPTEEELVLFYLHHKLKGTRPDVNRVIPVLDIYDYDPPDLPHLAGECCPADHEQWFFFVPRRGTEARGGRPNRLTSNGYWKATGSSGDVYSSRNRVIGRKRTMVFYEGRTPNGRKTTWKMNEYKAIETDHEASSSSSSAAAAHSQVREELSLCRIYKRSNFVRAFDRRPPQSEELIGNPVAENRQGAATNIHPEARILDGSNLNIDQNDQTNNPSHSVGSDKNWDFASDNESFWDLEQFDWFDHKE